VATPRRISNLTVAFQFTVLILAIIAFLYYAGEFLKPLALSVLLSFALAPAVRFLERRGLPRVAAVGLTVVIALGTLGAIGYEVGQQLTSLANRLPDYQENIERKINGVIKPGEQSAAGRLAKLADQVTAKYDAPPVEDDDGATPIQKVVVVSQPSFQERLRSVTGPYLEFLGVGSFVLILVLFILIGREDLGDRITHLFGHKQIRLTTRTTEEIGLRITRYLATFALVNSGFGLIIGLGLSLIGVRYAVLWGCLAAMMRFIPYLGPAVAFALPVIFSFALFPGWRQPLEVVVLFGVVEIALNSFLEPIIYGKTTGVTALGLLVAAMFWTWLWGTMGLLLSTPLTVCLAVLGKYVPSLRFFATFLGEEVELEPDAKFYQRLVSLDQDGAQAMIKEACKHMSRVEIFDRILVPALSRAERDAGEHDLGEQEQAFVWRVIEDILEDMDGSCQVSLAAPSLPADGAASGLTPPALQFPIVGIAVQDASDALVLEMLGQLIGPAGCPLEIITDVESPLELAERVAAHSPELVVFSHLPPGGLTAARYLVKRLRARLPELPIMVGRWSGMRGATSAERLLAVGATTVVSTLADAETRILAAAKRKRDPGSTSSRFATELPTRRESAKIPS
jgi:predicted PurR-regulated permease PerM